MADSATAKNLEAIDKALNAHRARCGYPAREIRMAPFEVERLGFDSFKGIPIVGEGTMGTGRIRVVCALDDAGLTPAYEEAVSTTPSEKVTADA